MQHFAVGSLSIVDAAPLSGCQIKVFEYSHACLLPGSSKWGHVQVWPASPEPHAVCGFLRTGLGCRGASAKHDGPAQPDRQITPPHVGVPLG